MDDWEKFNETLPIKVDFCSNLNMEDIKDSDYTQAKRVCKDLEIKYFGEYHGLYLKSDALLWVDVFEIYELDPGKFFSNCKLVLKRLK